MPNKDKFYTVVDAKPYRGLHYKPDQATASNENTSQIVVEDKQFHRQGVIQTQKLLKKQWFNLPQPIKYTAIAIAILSVLLLIMNTLFHRVNITTEPSTTDVTITEGWSIPMNDMHYMLSGEYRVFASAKGYQSTELSFIVDSNRQNIVNIALEKKPGHLDITIIPKVKAIALIDNVLVGEVPSLIKNIPAGEHMLEIQANGYEKVMQKVIVDGLDKVQSVNIQLSRVKDKAKSKEPTLPVKQPVAKKQRKRITRQQIENTLGLQFVTFNPRNQEVVYEKGRQRHSSLLSRSFAVGTKEINNQQFRKYKASHSSGQFQNNSLNDDQQPAANVSWSQAVAFANWLSQQVGITPFYIVQNGQVVGFNSESIGYRLLTELEWVKITQQDNQSRYPWGHNFRIIGEKFGNYADRSAKDILTNVLDFYNDKYPVSAPVGSFYANRYNIYDMDGNVAEWLHDVFTTFPYKEKIDPLGPRQGSNHTIRGGSWKYASKRMLGNAYRQYHNDQGRPEVGFRLAYYLN